MGGFDDLGTVSKFRDVIRRLVVSEVNKLRPGYTYATVAEIDRDARLCRVLFPGETTSVAIKLGSVVPTKVGQTVRVEGRIGDRYVADVIDDVTPLALQGSVDLPVPTGVTLIPSLNALTALWDEADPSLSYEVELAQDEGFSALVRKTRIAGTSFVAIGLLKQQDYYFRVRSEDALGNQGNWSPPAWVQTLTDAEEADIPEKSGVGGTPGDPIFQFTGPLVVSTSDIYDARGDEGWTIFIGCLVGSGASDTVTQLLVNGVPVETLTIPSGDNRAEVAISPTLVATDRVQTSVSTPGTGAVGLTLFPRKA